MVGPTRALAGAMFVVAVAAAGQAGAESLRFGPDLERQGWRHWTFRGFTPTRYEAAGSFMLAIRSRRSSSVLYRPLANPQPGAATLTWRWRVDRPVPPSDIGKKPGDDRSIGLYIAFAEGSDGPIARLGDALGLPPRALLDSGRVLIYVWGGSEPEGRSFPSPHAPDKTRILVRRTATAPNRVWLEERADLDADFRKAFGTAPPPIAAIAIASDSDDTNSESEGFIADIRIVSR